MTQKSKQVIIFPRGQLSAGDKAKLMLHHFIAIEADDPSKVVCHIPGTSIVSPDDLLLSALQALAQEDYSIANSKFVRALFERALKAKL